jgi:hypothetical protein
MTPKKQITQEMDLAGLPDLPDLLPSRGHYIFMEAVKP